MMWNGLGQRAAHGMSLVVIPDQMFAGARRQRTTGSSLIFLIIVLYSQFLSLAVNTLSISGNGST
ncbi:hypothetical protein BDW69DRAFT_150047 [Aspergillus filifer]